MTKTIVATGAGIATALVVLLVANMVVNTTPRSTAKGTYEYKIVKLDCAAPAIMDANGRQCVTDILNKEASDGWRLASPDAQSLMTGVVTFEKEQ